MKIISHHSLFHFFPQACSLEISTYILLGKGKLKYQVCFIRFTLLEYVQSTIAVSQK